MKADFLIAKEYIEPLTVTPQVPPYSKDETGNITIVHKDGSEVTVHIEVSQKNPNFPIVSNLKVQKFKNKKKSCVFVVVAIVDDRTQIFPYFTQNGVNICMKLRRAMCMAIHDAPKAKRIGPFVLGDVNFPGIFAEFSHRFPRPKFEFSRKLHKIFGR